MIRGKKMDKIKVRQTEGNLEQLDVRKLNANIRGEFWGHVGGGLYLLSIPIVGWFAGSVWIGILWPYIVIGKLFF